MSTPEYVMLTTKTRTGYSAHFPDLPGLAVAARTATELRTLAAEALALHLYALEEMGEEVPAPGAHPETRNATRVAPAPMNPVSLEIERAVRESGLSESEVARRMGVHRRTLNRLTNPFYWGHSLQSLNRVAQALGRSVRVKLEAA